MTPPAPEAEARQEIDRLLEAAGWVVCNLDEANITAHRGVAIREFPLKSGHGFADYLLYVAGKTAGVIEAKKAGATLIGVEIQSEKYTTGLPVWQTPLSSACESTRARDHLMVSGVDPASEFLDDLVEINL